jgi:ADP-ribosylglycohydrolase
MLLHLAIGDAYGAGFEFVKPQIIAKHNNLHYRDRCHKHWVSKGMYTDDTQMSIALAEAIVEDDPWTPLSLADRFVNTFKRDPRNGYSRRFYELLESVNSGAEHLERIIPIKPSSGAAMRSAPIGAMRVSEEEILRRCEIQARITHDNDEGVASSQGAALLVHYMFYQIDRKMNLFDYLRQHVPFIDWKVRDGFVGNLGVDFVLAAATALLHSKSMSQILLKSVAMTGDGDTVAALALAAGAYHPEIKQDLPPRLYAGLEKGKYGFDFLVDLNKKFLFHELERI